MRPFCKQLNKKIMFPQLSARLNAASEIYAFINIDISAQNSQTLELLTP